MLGTLLMLTSMAAASPPPEPDVVRRGQIEVDLPSTGGQYSTPLLSYETSVRGACGRSRITVTFRSVEKETIRGPIVTTATQLTVTRDDEIVVRDPSVLLSFDGLRIVSVRPVCTNQVIGLSMIVLREETGQLLNRLYQFDETGPSYYRQLPMDAEEIGKRTLRP